MMLFVRIAGGGRKMTEHEVSARKTVQGAWELSAMVRDSFGEYLLSYSYFGFGKREALAEFEALILERERL